MFVNLLQASLNVSFTAPLYASAVLSSCTCLSVCLLVWLLQVGSFTKTATSRITQTTSYDSLGYYLSVVKDRGDIPKGHPQRGAK